MQKESKVLRSQNGTESTVHRRFSTRREHLSTRREHPESNKNFAILFSTRRESCPGHYSSLHKIPDLSLFWIPLFKASFLPKPYLLAAGFCQKKGKENKEKKLHLLSL